jgi:hypothetical protein
MAIISRVPRCPGQSAVCYHSVILLDSYFFWDSGMFLIPLKKHLGRHLAAAQLSQGGVL